MRLFVAVRFSEELCGALASVQDQIRARGIRGNLTPRRNFHLTLAFIGEYPDAGRVLRVMRTVPFSPFALRLNGMGSFGSLW